MRILRGHDYYDIGLSLGQDDDILFIRDGKTIPVDDVPLMSKFKAWGIDIGENFDYFNRYNNSFRFKKHVYEVETITVVVAGKQYGGVKIYVGDAGMASSAKALYYWNFEKLAKKLDELGVKIKAGRDWETSSGVYGHSLENWMKPRPLTESELDWAIKNKVSIAIPESAVKYYCQNKTFWKINCAEPQFNLKEIGFAEVMDPYTLFQELSMWIGGVLPKDGPPMVEIKDEKILTAKHGFNKWSFRKHKDDAK